MCPIRWQVGAGMDMMCCRRRLRRLVPVTGVAGGGSFSRKQSLSSPSFGEGLVQGLQPFQVRHYAFHSHFSNTLTSGPVGANHDLSNVDNTEGTPLPQNIPSTFFIPASGPGAVTSTPPRRTGYVSFTNLSNGPSPFGSPLTPGTRLNGP